MKQVKIYTDGACSGNPGIGGWGAILISGQHKKEISDYSDNTTNNRMELTAVIKSLEVLKEPCEIDIFTDSKYVHNGITQWIINWKKNNWKKVKNTDLWQQLDKLVMDLDHKINWHWVKGHNGDYFNEIADKLATTEITKYKLIINKPN